MRLMIFFCQANPHRGVLHSDQHQHKCVHVLSCRKRCIRTSRCQRTSSSRPTGSFLDRLWYRLRALGSLVRRVRTMAYSAAKFVPRQHLANSMRFVEELRDICGGQNTWRSINGWWFSHARCSRRYVGAGRTRVRCRISSSVISRWVSCWCYHWSVCREVSTSLAIFAGW
jgi:hypothetical protein